MGKFVKDNESLDLFDYDVNVVKYATWEYQKKLEQWEDTGEWYRCGGYNASNGYNPWRTVVGLELEMTGQDFCLNDYTPLLHYGIFSEDSTVMAEYKGLPFKLSDWVRIVAENRDSFNEFLYSNDMDNGAGLHVHISQRCLSDDAAEYIRAFLCNCGEDALEAIAGRELPNDHVAPYNTLDTGKYGYITRHKKGVTWEVRVFQSPDSWKGLIKHLVWVAILIENAGINGCRITNEGLVSDYTDYQVSWDQIFKEMLKKFEDIYPKILGNLKKLQIRQEEIDLAYLEDEDEEDEDNEDDESGFYDLVTDEFFYSYESYAASLEERVLKNPYSYMEPEYRSIKDLYRVGESSTFFESSFSSLWLSYISYDVIRWMDDQIKEVLYNELREYIKHTPWKKLLVPTVQDLFWVSRREPLGHLVNKVREYGFNEDAIVDEFVESFLNLDFPEWYRDECREYHRYNHYFSDYSLQKYPTEDVLYDYLREEIRKLVRHKIQTAWVIDYESPTIGPIVFEYSNTVLGVKVFTQYSDLYPMLPLNFQGVSAHKIANAIGIPSCWIVR